MGYLIFCRTERTTAAFSATARFQSFFQNEHTTNNAEQKRTENAARRVSLNEIVRRTATEKRTDNEQRNQHRYGIYPLCSACSAKLEIYPRTYAHTCATIAVRRCVVAARVVCLQGKGWANFCSQCESYQHPTVTRHCYRHPNSILLFFVLHALHLPQNKKLKALRSFSSHYIRITSAYARITHLTLVLRISAHRYAV